MPTHVAIFVSGSGTNCENIIRHFQGHTDVVVALVLANKPDAQALARAERLGIATEVMPKAQFNDATLLMPLLRRYGIDFIVLAGFLLMIPDFLIKAFPHRMVNLHPALLPKFGGRGMYGHHVHEAVKAAGESETGFTVHWVSGVCDGGEVIAQRKVALLPTDTADDIAAKEHELEMQHFPQIIDDIIAHSSHQ